MIKKQEQKENKGFVIINKEHMLEMRWLTGKSKTAGSILNFIIEYMDCQNTLIYSSQEFINHFNISQSTVSKCLKLLKDNGFIDIIKNGTSNTYIVNPEIAQYSWDSQKNNFQGNKLISLTENKNQFYTDETNHKKHY